MNTFALVLPEPLPSPRRCRDWHRLSKRLYLRVVDLSCRPRWLVGCSRIFGTASRHHLVTCVPSTHLARHSVPILLAIDFNRIERTGNDM